MSDVGAIDGAKPIEDNNVALLNVKTALSTSNPKVEEEGNPHAVSATVINQEGIGAAQALQLVQAGAPATKADERSNLIGKPGRYKNPILAIFATMSVARKTMQDVSKSSKEETRLMKKQWERISHEVSDHHDTAAKSSEKIQKYSACIGSVLALAPHAFKSIVPSDQAGYDNWISSMNGWAHMITESFTPSDYIKGAAGDKKEFVEWINWGAQNAQKMSEPILQQSGQSAQMANQRDVAVGQQQSEASRVEYQSRQDEKRNEDEAVKTIDQMTQRLMEQEVRAFEVRG